ncbi:hypothetical protein DCS32_03645 [Dokdonia sp. Dokd-P16]|uniref:hypothetical protein n=1 Tax=Dokdonia sp. Dokd-P16 TaxID=2173169 RepID=UPI000D543C78|nr:hypothetical protein [Dokdonia sp. Dokd-P16]AWH73287.1 hypothetical protein DCS32_03645 [Dokdonia sp. Dokd-P16]
MNYYLPLLLCLFTISKATSQSANLDRNYIHTEYVSLPQVYIKDDAQRTYTVRVENAMRSDIKASQLYDQTMIAGFTKLDTDATLNISMRINRVEYGEVTTEKIKNEKKDDDGKVISTSYSYTLHVPYTTSARLKVINNLNPNLGYVSNLGKRENYKRTSFKTSKAAIDYWNGEGPKFRAKTSNDFYAVATSTFIDGLARRYGYVIKRNDKTQLWFLGNKKHPEFIKHQETYEAIKRAFTAMKYDQTVTDIAAKIAPQLTYLEQIVQDYQGKGRKLSKVRYASYYNLAKIYYYLDQPEKAKQFARLLIDNKYDKADGKLLLKNAEALEKRLASHSTDTRHREVFTEEVHNAGDTQPVTIVQQTLVAQEVAPVPPTIELSQSEVVEKVVLLLRAIHAYRPEYVIHQPHIEIKSPSEDKVLGIAIPTTGYSNREIFAFVWKNGLIIKAGSKGRYEFIWNDNKITSVVYSESKKQPYYVDYDEFGKVVELQQNSLRPSGYLKTYKYTYDISGRVTRVIHIAIDKKKAYLINNHKISYTGANRRDWTITNYRGKGKNEDNNRKEISRKYSYVLGNSLDGYTLYNDILKNKVNYIYNTRGDVKTVTHINEDKSSKTLDYTYNDKGEKLRILTIFKDVSGEYNGMEVELKMDITNGGINYWEHTKGKYRFNAQDELIYEERSYEPNKYGYRNKVNGVWSDWGHFYP